MAKPKVLICAALDHPTLGVIWAYEELLSQLGAVAEIVELTSRSRAQFFEECQGKYADILAIYRHTDSVPAIGFFDEELIAHLPRGLKYISHNGAGYDQINVAACTRRGIQVSHTPGAVDDATATTAVFLIISALRQYSYGEKSARSGLWKGRKHNIGRDPEGKTVGIIGMGGIGKAVARRLIPFGMDIIYYNRGPLATPPDFPCTYMSSLDELLARSDVVSLHMPLNAQTRDSFGKAQMDKMKDGAVLVNTARGAIVVEDDLIEAMNSGKVSRASELWLSRRGSADNVLSAAGLDVFPDEPNINPVLQNMDQITILPHMGTDTRDTQKKMEMQVISNLVSAVTGKGLVNLVPEQQ